MYDAIAIEYLALYFSLLFCVCLLSFVDKCAPFTLFLPRELCDLLVLIFIYCLARDVATCESLLFLGSS